MRRRRAWVAGLWAAVVGLGVNAMGCGSDCERSQTCAPEGPPTGGGNPEDGCVPVEGGWGIGAGCGVFVSARFGDDANAGTQDAPLQTLAAAVARAQQDGTARVYACNEPFVGPVTVPGGVTFYGALDCEHDWTYVPNSFRTEITAPPGEIPLRIGGGEGVARIVAVDVIGPELDDEDPAMQGMSSIAAVAEGEVEFVSCLLDSRGGANGAPGEPYTEPGMAGPDGNPGGEACSAAFVLPGADALNDCGTPDDPSDDSIGGAGGLGQATSGATGTAGSPGGDMNDNGGYGETVVYCHAGEVGLDGVEGAPGAGAVDLGLISSQGFTGTWGSDGARGLPAQGGGGGGGAKGGTGAGKCGDVASAGGASGGSGGAGGCGGLGGKGGGPGGSSIALISLNATIHFESCVLGTGNAGRGGEGGPGQEGGAGGLGGEKGLKGAATALQDACVGGPGGKGGTGGKGGGGLGGHSIAIAYIGEPPPIDDLIIYLAEPGRGGYGADEEHRGAMGIQAELVEFPAQ